MPENRILPLFFDHAPDLLCITSQDGRFRKVNPSWTRVLGWTADELIGQLWLDFIHPDDRPMSAEAGAKLAHGERVSDLINRYRCKDGSYRSISWHSLLASNDSGLVMTVGRDVTETESLRRHLDDTQRQFAAVLQNAPIGLHLWEACPDNTLKLVLANQAADRFTNIDTQALLGKTIEQAFPGTIQHGLPARYRAVALGQAPSFQLCKLPYQDDHINGFFDAWIFPVGNQQVAVFFVEVTERIRQERALLTSREDLRITLDSIGDGVIATDRNGLVTRINRIAQTLTGWSTAEAIGKHVDAVFDIVNAETGARVESPVTRVLREGQVVGLANHTALVQRGGTRVQIADSGAPIRGDDGSIEGVVLVFRDVTEEYALQRQLHHAQKMEAVGQLAGGIAHDFNNLLGGIIGAAEMLERHATHDERSRRWLEMITSCSSRAAELTQKLLAFGRKTQIQVLPIDLKALIHQVAGILEHTLDRKIALRLDLPAEPVWMQGDPSQVQSAVLNLALNARDAMPGGGTLRVTLAVAELAALPPCRHAIGSLQSGTHAAIAVTDNGCGVPGEMIERIFEPFFTTKGPGEGSGLGLASVYSAAKSHHGAVTVDSRPGSGSTFTIYLPVSELGNALPAERREAPPSLRGKRILVVDDEPAIRSAVASWLEDEGFLVDSAANGEEAISSFVAEQPDIVLLDLVMPGHSGAEVFHSLRQHQPNACILLMSGYNLHGAKADALLTEGAAGFLQKPFRFEDLGAAIQRLLRARR